MRWAGDYDDDGYDGPAPRRRRTTYGCSDRMCGATDCTTCYGPSAGDEPDDDDPERSERPRLHEAGYTYMSDGCGGGTWEITVSKKRRTARRDHADGKVKAGDVYIETVTRYIDDETGKSHHTRGRWVVQS